MGIVLEEGFALSVYPVGKRFGVRVWSEDRDWSVDAVHGTFSCALKLALRRAFDEQDRQDRQDREPDPGPVFPSPALLATVLQTATEAVA